MKCSGGTDKARQERAKQIKPKQPVTPRGRQEEETKTKSWKSSRAVQTDRKDGDVFGTAVCLGGRGEEIGG